MATAEDGGATSTAAPSYGGGGGGAGGKFRKRPFRKTTTPYERPVTTLRGNGSSSSSSSSSWLSKLVVDPATKLFSYGARRFFQSIYRKQRLPPPPPPISESNNVLSDGRPEAVLSNQYGAQEPAIGDCRRPLSRNGISDLEQLLEQKTFTRSEIDHLTKLLHSRAGERSLRDDERINKVTVSDFQEHTKIGSDPSEASRYEDRSHGVDSKVVGHSIASPFELAKAYMGSRASNLSPSVLGNHSQVTRKDTKLLSTMRVASKPVSMSLTTKSTVRSGLTGSPGNGYMTNPRSLGRSAIYNMARAPYLKRTGFNHNGYAELSAPSTSLTLENSGNTEAKPMTLKRRSFVLDDGVGSVGSIRSIRQKSNLIASGIHHTERVGDKSDAILVSLKEKFPSNDDANHAKRTQKDNTDVSIPSTSYSIVPLKTNGVDVGVRRFRNLESQLLKDKSSESNMVAVRQKSTFQLTSSMLCGQARRSMEDATSSDLLLNVQDDHNFESSAGFMDADDSTAQDQLKVEEDGPIETSSPSGTYYPVNNSDSAVPFEDSLIIGRSSDDLENGLSEPQKKAAFRMTALEDYVDLDDDLPSNELVCRPSNGRGSLEDNLTNGQFSPIIEHKILEKAIQPDLESHSDRISNKRDAVSSAVAVAALLGEGSNGTTSRASEEVTAAARPFILPPPVSESEKPKETNKPPSLFNFSSSVADKFPSLMPEKGSRTPESSSSLLDVFAPTSSPVTVSEPEKNGYLKPLAGEDTNGESDTVTSAASNGLLISNAPTWSFRVLSNNNTQQISTGPPAIFTPSVSVSDFIQPGTGSVSSAPSNKISFGASDTPKVSGESASKFGVSPDPSTKVSSALTSISPAEDLRNKLATDINSGSSISLTNFVAFGTSSSGNMTSGLSSSTSDPSANNSQGSLFSSAGKSFMPAFGTVTQEPSTTQTNSFTLPPASNTNKNSSFVSSSSSAQVSNTIVSFGFNSSGSSSDTGVVASISGSTSSLFAMNPIAVSDSRAGGSSGITTPSVFSFGVSSSTPSVNAVGSTSSGAPAPFFGFGANSSGPASVTTSSFGSSPLTSAVGSTGGASAPVFGFGAGGSTGAAAPVFSFGAGSSGSASLTASSFPSSPSTTSGAASSAFSFGMSNSASASASNGVSSFSNGASSVFSFGGSSSASSSAINSVNSNNAPSNLFGSGSSLQAPPTSSIFGSSPATGFAFGASTMSSAPTNAAAVAFNSSNVPSLSSPFTFSSNPAPSLFSSQAPSLSQPVFGNPAQSFAAPSQGNNYQMNGEDSMAEDPVQLSEPSGPVFGQSNISPSPPGFMFGSATVPSQANIFQFGGQQNQGVPQNPPVFQASSSVGGSFSLGNGGGDKSGRKYVKVNRSKNRKK